MKNCQNMIINEAAIERIGLKIIIQATRDFAFPKQMDNVKCSVSKLSKKDPMYKEHVNRIFRRERQRIIGELKSDFLVSLTNGKSNDVADKLQAILNDKTGDAMRKFRKNVRSLGTSKED